MSHPPKSQMRPAHRAYGDGNRANLMPKLSLRTRTRARRAHLEPSGRDVTLRLLRTNSVSHPMRQATRYDMVDLAIDPVWRTMICKKPHDSPSVEPDWPKTPVAATQEPADR